jgi:hypothetical protein
MRSGTDLFVRPSVVAMLFAVPIGNMAIGVRLPISSVATLPTVPSPPEITMMSHGFSIAFFHFFFFEDW